MAIVNPEKSSQALTGFGTLPFLRQIGILVGLAVSIALGVSIALWSMDPNFRPLYSNISSEDAGQVIDVLQQAGIAYKLDKNTGTILVDGDDIHDARIKLASEGLPKGGNKGLSFLNESGGFGSSAFLETARYRHALEAELARTITNFRNIKSARVHLALPKQSVFLRDKREPSASVFIDVYSNRGVGTDKVSSIVHLVASSIPNLDSARVTVVDNHGNLLTDGSGSNKITMANRVLNYRNQVENAYVDKIQGILTPLVGMGKVRARVSADIDFTSSEKTHETFNPEKSVIRSEQIMEEKRLDASSSAGIPGALSNKPNAASNDKAEASKDAVQEGMDTKKQATKNYELDKTISHTKYQPGTVKRLTVAVVVDNKEVIDPKTKEMSYKPLSKEEVQKIEILVKDAIGYSKKRGDSVNVINSSFAKAKAVAPIPELSFWQQNWFYELLKQVAAGVFILVLLFGVLKPLLKSLASRPAPTLMQGPNGQTIAVSHDAAQGEGGAGGPRLPGKLQSYDDQMQVLQGMAVNDPKRVAQVVKTWVGD